MTQQMKNSLILAVVGSSVTLSLIFYVKICVVDVVAKGLLY